MLLFHWLYLRMLLLLGFKMADITNFFFVFFVKSCCFALGLFFGIMYLLILLFALVL